MKFTNCFCSWTNTEPPVSCIHRDVNRTYDKNRAMNNAFFIHSLGLAGASETSGFTGAITELTELFLAATVTLYGARENVGDSREN